MSVLSDGVRLGSTLLFAVLIGVGWTKPASATLIGDSVTIDWLFPDTATTFGSDTVVVGVGPEVSCHVDGGPICAGFLGASSVTFDISAAAIRFDIVVPISTFFSAGSFNGFLFSGLDWQNGPGSLVGFQLTSSFAGVTDSAVAFGPDFISINLANEPVTQGREFFQLDLIVKHGVPEPASVALLALGLIGVAALRRRKTKARS